MFQDRGEFVTALCGRHAVGAEPLLAAWLHITTSERKEALIGAGPESQQVCDFMFQAASGCEILGLQVDTLGHICGVKEAAVPPKGLTQSRSLAQVPSRALQMMIQAYRGACHTKQQRPDSARSARPCALSSSTAATQPPN